MKLHTQNLVVGLLQKPILNRDKKISNKINSSYFESSASITEDESYIYFVSERPTGLGKTDIYYVKKN